MRYVASGHAHEGCDIAPDASIDMKPQIALAREDRKILRALAK